jgi:ABC-type branched-subunit amino acid transport system ATPase component/predicted MFS family arabinose efflux permease
MIARLRERVTGGAPLYPLAVLFGLNAADELDRSAFEILIPEIRDHFHLSTEGIFTVVALIAVPILILEIPIAFNADRFSRVRIAVGGAITWGCFALMTGLAPTIAFLALARSGAGIGRAVNTPTHNSLIADYYDLNVRGYVYGAHRAANNLGQFLGPALGGVLAYFFGWRAPFIVFVIPTIVLVILALRLKEPTRGVHERVAMGATEEVAATEEAPPSFAEAWRIAWQVKTLRRIWMSLPFLAAAFLGLRALLAIFYEDIFGLNEATRGFVFAGTELFAIAGILIGIPIANKLLIREPGLALRFLGFAGVVIAILWAILAVTPVLPLAILMHGLIAGTFAILGPGIYAALSLSIPPRIRSLGFSVGSLFIVPGVLVLVIIGGIADDVGVRKGLLVMVPVFLIGAAIIGSAGKYVGGDIAKVRASTLAQSEVLAARRKGQVKLLLVKDLDVSYTGTQVLFGVNFEVDQGEIVALLGTNGAGKTTLLKTISGLVEADAGAVIFDGRDMTYAPPHEVAARGVVQVPGGKGAFPSLTVEENLRLAGWLFANETSYLKQATEEVLRFFPVLRDRWDQPAGNLSGGEQQMLTLGQAFIAKPQLLMIDELSLGLAPIIVEQLLGIVRAIRDHGTTIILVEQSVNVALTLAETAYFMEKGEIRFNGPTKELLKRPDVLRSVFLEGAGAAIGNGPAAGNGTKRRRAKTIAVADRATALRVDSVRRSFGGITAVDDVTFDLPQGQILGVIGPNGAGKTTLFDLISGYLPPDSGKIELEGADITPFGPESRARLGLGRSFQDARLFPALTVGECVMLALERQVEVRDPIAAALNLPAVKDSERKLRVRADELIDLMGLEAFRNKFISELSTGSRRIVDLACVLAHDPKVLLFDEPSSGIAQRETEALAPLLLRIREATDASLLVIEHDMPLVTTVSDEMIALDLGRVIARGTPKKVVNDAAVIEAYLGTTEAVIKRSGTMGEEPKKRKRTKPKARVRGGSRR